MPPRRARRRARPARRPLLSSVLAAVVVVGGATAGSVYVKGGAPGGDGAVSSSPTSSAARASGETSVKSVVASGVDGDGSLAAALEDVAVEEGAELSVAVLDVTSGRSATYGTARFETASIVKADILAALLLQAQDAGRELTAQEEEYAVAMIEESDNASASALWRTIGEEAGLDAANERFGLTGTEGGEGGMWGLTRTTAADQLVLLRQIFGDGSESLLDESSRSYLRELMGGVVADQGWGVSAAGSDSALKNGWLPRTATGLWVVNSVGRVTADGDEYLVAVLSRGSTTKEKGITMVEAAARAAVSAVTARNAGE
ncbi:serine hydrolase [Streptomyces sp. CRN 30]|uniref:serine hydrolase n=1 Tax=Streptomyces sp. CRN 30 TaxID=3075613 RepID=UPI002A7F81AE|nr:serine hydrolase [Streptomyces sp. CRN 30]